VTLAASTGFPALPEFLRGGLRVVEALGQRGFEVVIESTRDSIFRIQPGTEIYQPASLGTEGKRLRLP